MSTDLDEAFTALVDQASAQELEQERAKQIAWQRWCDAFEDEDEDEDPVARWVLEDAKKRQ